MRSFILFLLMLNCLTVCGEEVEETWVIAGQSNAVGTAPLPGADPSEKVLQFDAVAKKWVPAKEPLRLHIPAVGTSAWLTAAKAYSLASGSTIKLTGYALGGKAIAHWDPETPSWKTMESILVREAKTASCFFWYQGESDALEKTAPDVYIEKLKDLVKRVRTLCSNPKMPAVIVQLANSNVVKDKFREIREAQRKFVIEDGNAVLVPALGLPMQDGLHLSKEGYFRLGEDIAKAVQALKGKKDVNWAGPVMDAAVLSQDGKTVMVHFAEVKLLQNAAIEDFIVSDASGATKVSAIKCEKTCAMLTLEKPIKGAARIVCGVEGKLQDEVGNHAAAVQLEMKVEPVPDDKPTLVPNGAGMPVRK